jgi:serine/threonine protein kinase
MELVPGQTRIGNYILLKQIGSGAFASVWMARHTIADLNVAIKAIDKKSIESQEAKTRFSREVSLLKKMSHPFIAEFFEWIEDETRHYLVIEFAENGNMLDFINGKGQLTESQARNYFSQLVSVLEYLHFEKMVAHRDLKAENILLDRYYNIRVIDFGLSNQFTQAEPELKTACGSPAYAAPEMIKGQAYTRAADVWSAGILLFSMVAGCLPYEDDNIQRLLQKIVYTEIHYPGFMSPPLIDLLRKMLSKNPETRITLDRLKEHHWFSQTEYTALISMQGTEQSCSESAVDKEIVDQMTGLGIDCHPLVQQLLVGDFTELTAMYKLLKKEKQTEKMKDLLQNLQNVAAQRNPQQATPKFAFAPFGSGKPLGKVQFPMATGGTIPFPRAVQTGTMPVPPQAPKYPRTGGNGPIPAPFPVGQPGGPAAPQTRLPVPGQVQIAARRMSRPVAARPAMDVRTAPTTSHETPN